MADLLEQNEEIQDALSRSYGVGEDFDEADLDAELDALGDLDEFEFEDEPSSVPSYLADVSIPTTDPGAPVAATCNQESVDEFGLPLVPQSMGACPAHRNFTTPSW